MKSRVTTRSIAVSCRERRIERAKSLTRACSHAKFAAMCTNQVQVVFFEERCRMPRIVAIRADRKVRGPPAPPQAAAIPRGRVCPELELVRPRRDSRQPDQKASPHPCSGAPTGLASRLDKKSHHYPTFPLTPVWQEIGNVGAELTMEMRGFLQGTFPMGSGSWKCRLTHCPPWTSVKKDGRFRQPGWKCSLSGSRRQRRGNQVVGGAAAWKVALIPRLNLLTLAKGQVEPCLAPQVAGGQGLGQV